MCSTVEAHLYILFTIIAQQCTQRSNAHRRKKRNKNK